MTQNRDGVLLMYSIPTKEKHKRSSLERVAEKYDLEKSLIPNGTAPSDKFRKASRDVINRPEWRNLADNKGRKVKLQWTSVPTKDNPIHKNKIQLDLMQQIMGGATDSANYLENPVEHSIFKMFFHKDIQGKMIDRITFQMPRDKNGNPDHSSWVEGVNYREFINQIMKQVDIYDQYMDSIQATEMIKVYVKRLGGTLFRKMRAVWYIPEDRVEHALRFQNAIREWSDGVIDIHHVPIQNTQTAELKEFFEQHLLDELRGIDEEISLDGRMQDRLLSRLQREMSYFRDVFNSYSGNVDRKKIDAAMAVVSGKMNLALEANKRWKEEKEANKIRQKENNKKIMKETKHNPQQEDNRLSVL